MRGIYIETACWVAGSTLMVLYGIARADAELGRRLDVARIEQARAPDYSTWSQSRVHAFQASLQQATGPLVGTLKIRALNLEVPLYADTSEVHLNRGVGVIEGTSMPGDAGNLGVAGHRDGFFRALRRAQVGDTVEIRTWAKLYTYRISNLSIVASTDARLLSATAQPVLTLVTCYPFYFVGHAPQRFVVRGVLVSTQERKT